MAFWMMPDDLMVEIGPGLGALTQPLLKTLRHLHVVEIDRDIVTRLHREYAPERVTVHACDALKFDFGALGKLSFSAWVLPTEDLKVYREIFRKEDGDQRVLFSFQDSIDLHGLVLDEAEAEVEDFLKESLKRCLRCVWIIHGRGLRSPRGPVVKAMVVDMLSRRFRKDIIAFVTARQCDGGLGAGKLAKLEPTAQAGKDEAFVRHAYCPWFHWHKHLGLLSEDRPGCDLWFEKTVQLINEKLGTKLRVETRESLAEGGSCCLRRIWVE